MGLSPEMRQRIYEEERIRLEARQRYQAEVRLRQQTTAFVFRTLMIVAVFGIGYVTSSHLLDRLRTVPEVPPSQAAPSPVGQAVLDDVVAAARPEAGGEVCATAIARPRIQVRTTIELDRDLSRAAARRLAMDKAKDVGAALRKNGLAIPAYVEVFSPKQWYGVALYDSDTLKITWDPCPGNCEQEGARTVRRCRE